MSEVFDQRVGAGSRGRHRVGTKAARNIGNLGKIGILIAQRHRRFAKPDPRVQKRRGPRDMDPREKPWVIGSVRRTIRHRACDMRMDSIYPVDGSFGFASLRISSQRQKTSGPSKPTQHVLAEITMVPDTCKCRRMKHFEQKP